jgi:hypothetical protein
MIALLFCLTPAVDAQAQTFNLYDAFTGPLSPGLWNGAENNTNSAVISNTETSRAVVQPDPLVANRFLQLMLRSGHLGTGGNAGSAGEGRQRLIVARDDIQSGDPSVVGMRTRITVTGMATPGCPTSADPVLFANQTRSRAALLGFYFNDGSSTGPTDFTGDIVAGIQLEQRSTDGKLIVGFISRCDNAACSTSTTQKFVNFTRKWALNVAVPLTVVWERANNRFVYTAGTEIHTLTYDDIPLSDALPPVLLLYDLRVSDVLANCSTAIRAAVTARFDFLHLATEAGVFP